ncbi:MAG: cobalamin-dependent protein [Desulfobacterales bacterium]|nr:cobalamin-dependent protein [Desulfobacterales bacterium]
MSEDLVKAIADLKEEDALRITRQRLESGDVPRLILEDSRKAMEIVGQRFAGGEYFMPDLIYSGEILKVVTEMVKPKLGQVAQTSRLAKFVLGTVAGDIHDIGKDIVSFMLDVNGFEVHDLGVNVPPGKFVEKIAEVKPQIVGLSGFLTLAFDSMKETVEAIKAAGHRDQVKIMIGGGQMDAQVCKYAGADAYGRDAMAGVMLAKQWTKG